MISRDEFLVHLRSLIKSKDGNWIGFELPDNYLLSDIEFDFAVNMSWANLGVLTLRKVTFHEPFYCEHAFINGNLSFHDVSFKSSANFKQSIFSRRVDIQATEFNGAADFYQCEFKDRSLFRCRFNASVNLNNVIFHEGVHFRGSRTVFVSINETISVVDSVTAKLSSSAKPVKIKITVLKRIYDLCHEISTWCKVVYNYCVDAGKKIFNVIYKLLKRVYDQVRVNITAVSGKMDRLFLAEAQIQDVEFRRPERTVFSMVDLSRTYLRGTNLRGVKFWDVIWWQPKLKRNGLYDELFIGKSKDRGFRKVYLPQLEETCRNVRVALEDNRDYSAAADFYIGEMEASRAQKPFFKRHIFSVVATYRCLSGYGTRPLQAFLMFLVLLSIHSGLTLLLSGISNEDVLKAGGFQISTSPLLDMGKILISCLLNSLQVMTLQRTDSLIKVGDSQNLFDTVFRVLGPAQLSLTVLALRARIKRH